MGNRSRPRLGSEQWCSSRLWRRKVPLPPSPAPQVADQAGAEATPPPIYAMWPPPRAHEASEAHPMSDRTVHVFDTSDDDYLLWLGQYPHSFVVNTRRGLPA
jgi:hypothetical protein